MKTKSIFLLTLALGVALTARAYNHKWTGAASDAWSNGQNWTNNFPNPTEFRAMRLFFPSMSGEYSPRQDVPGLFVDYMEINGEYQFLGGPGAALGFRNTNADPILNTISFANFSTFEDDLEIILHDTVRVRAGQSGQQNGLSGSFKGRISGPGSFFVRGGGTLEFAGTEPNTYLGLTHVADGTLRLNKTGATAIRGGLTIGYLEPYQYDAKVQFLQANQLASTTMVMVNSNGWLDLNNHSQTIAGLTMRGGRVTTGLGQLTLQGNVLVDSENQQAVIDGRLALGYVSRTFDVQQKYSNECLVVNARISGDSAASIIKDGPGTLIFSGTNSYNGATVINDGTLVVRGHSPLGSAINGTVVNDGATLHVEDGDLGDEPLSLAGEGVDQFAALFIYGNTTGAGPVTLTAPAKVRIYPFHSLTWYGVVSGPGDLDVGLGGRFVMGGDSANTYTGATYTYNCDVELRKHILTLGGGIGLVAVPGPLYVGSAPVSLFYDNQIADTSPVFLTHKDGRLELNGNRDIIGSLSGDLGEVALGDGELIIGGNPNSTTTAALISGAGGKLRKIGPSTLTLRGTNTYTGVTAADGGTLVINGIQPASAITVRSNATLSGSGTVGTIGAVSGIVSPGAGVGRLNSKTVAFDAASVLRVELNGPQSGVSHDQLNVTGVVSLGGCALQPTLGYPGAVGTQFLIIANDGVDAVVGTFAGKPQGATFAFGGATFQINYQGGDGNDVVLTQLTESTQVFVPELSIVHQPPQSTRLSWTTNALGFQLLSSPTLQPAAWTPVPEPIVVIADENTVTVPATNANMMFRLFKP